MNLIIFLSLFLISKTYSAEETTNYEYYTKGGIKSGLKADNSHFTLNEKNITIISGSLHYFRVPHQYWSDRLLKFKAAGLNAVQFYSPWNLHEEIPGHYDFENGFLNLTAFLKAIKDADMFAVYRPGPYICSEWDLGGLPSWLLRDPNMHLRSNYGPYLKAVEKYFEKVLHIVKENQFTPNGGPIIAMQIENEFGGIKNAQDLEYFNFLKDTVRKNGYEGLIFTSDPGDTADKNPNHGLKDVLETMNMNGNVLKVLTEMRVNQPNKALYVSEYWSAQAWGDQWGAKKQTNSVAHFGQQYEDILFKANASLNVYMFFGGTNFGFMNGANGGRSDKHSISVITSYDYDAPLSESGNYTEKYWKVKELNEKFIKERNLPKIKTPAPPKEIQAVIYGNINVTQYLPLNQVLSKIKPFKSENPIFMEMLNIGPNYGQNFGFIVYRTQIPKAKQLKITKGVSDRTIILIDNKEVAVIEYSDKEIIVNISDNFFDDKKSIHDLEIMVENKGRYNFGIPLMNNERKGINGSVLIDDKPEHNWDIYPLEFKQKFVEELKNEKWLEFNNIKSPAIFRATLDISGKPNDTFLNFKKWNKGIVFVNGFNIGRYWNIGPQYTLYIPAPFLKTGKNDIFMFELHSAVNSIEFVDKAILL